MKTYFTNKLCIENIRILSIQQIIYTHIDVREMVCLDEIKNINRRREKKSC